MPQVITTDPDRRMGVFKQLKDVPDRYRLKRYESAYLGRDVWQEFVVTRSLEFDSDHYHAVTRRAGTAWKEHMNTQNRHHALCRPSDVEAYLTALSENRTRKTVYHEYWIRVEQFFRWLQFHTAHPHLYNPVLMAAAEYDTAQVMWSLKMKGRTGEA